jgi:hypothetical protein
MHSRTYIYGPILILGVLLIAGGAYTLFHREQVVEEYDVPVAVQPETPTTTIPATNHEVIGMSVEERPIEVYTYGNGPTHLLFVGGIHGGYEWNSVLLAYSFIDHLEASPESIPENLTINIIPSLNPDGVFKVTGKDGRFAQSDVKEGLDPATIRFNAHGIDLNRNFDCKWKPTSTWRSKVVSAGTSAFSEPEAQTLRDYVTKINPAGVVFWHSQSNAVYASECTEGILPGTRTLMETYATGAKYPAVDSFDAYPVTGDAEGWLASIGIPAITVELSTHETIEWDRNLAGFDAVLSHYRIAK